MLSEQIRTNIDKIRWFIPQDIWDILDKTADDIAKLERVATLAEMLFSNSAPRDIYKQLEEALEDAKRLLEES